MFAAEVAPHMPEGLTVVADKRLTMADGNQPIAWIDDRGNVMPVEKHQPLSILPPGAYYIFTPDELRQALGGGGIIVPPVNRISDPARIGQVTGEAPPPEQSMKPEISRAQAMSAFNSVLGVPTHMVR